MRNEEVLREESPGWSNGPAGKTGKSESDPRIHVKKKKIQTWYPIEYMFFIAHMSFFSNIATEAHSIGRVDGVD